MNYSKEQEVEVFLDTLKDLIELFPKEGVVLIKMLSTAQGTRDFLQTTKTVHSIIDPESKNFEYWTRQRYMLAGFIEMLGPQMIHGLVQLFSLYYHLNIEDKS